MYVYDSRDMQYIAAALRALLIKNNNNKQLRCYLRQRLDGFTALSRYFRGKKKNRGFKIFTHFSFSFFFFITVVFFVLQTQRDIISHLECTLYT